MTEAVMKQKVEVELLKTGLNKSDRSELAENLSDVLAETMQLMVRSQIYHWNVVGPLFKPVHDLTETHYNNLFAAADVLAERVRALGYPVPYKSSGNKPASLSISDKDSIPSTKIMLNNLIKDHEKIVRTMRKTSIVAEKSDDFVTHDILVSRMTYHEKAIWMLRSITVE